MPRYDTHEMYILYVCLCNACVVEVHCCVTSVITVRIHGADHSKNLSTMQAILIRRSSSVVQSCVCLLKIYGLKWLVLNDF